ncbi:MAG: hypothetical protein Q8S11_09880 [Daejeonella sp.]|uniref:right-handed parallel beta-helix repeat-containing protein n=1 Tax=Daejeonella sp. TaxID=2805397 RepID=UPI002736F1FC|nr:right-handed parallel beta-helix repeat-containing protein [Daejeonella sp.]MDP3468631.1 hypothetical protein [Daejeonella sp.]
MGIKNFNRRQFVTAASLGSLAAFSSITPAIANDINSAPEYAKKEKPTWKKIGNAIYGAKADEGGPIGGGKGYTKIITSGDYTVDSLESLIDALGKVKSGQVVFIPGDLIIDMTTFIYIDKIMLKIPGGVTLASDRGHNGSAGAQITSDSLDTPGMISIEGPGVRLSGIRLQGPNSKRYLDHHKRSFGPGGPGHTYYYKFPTSRGIITKFGNLEIDNCEISAFANAGVSLQKGTGSHIHHNLIHKCQYNGLGYGVSHDEASSLIEFNQFNENRHSLAGTGRPGCGYIARHNVELGISLSHNFDMHGGRDRKDNTTIAGTTMEMYNNTFLGPQRAVVIRGVPQDKCDVHHNWMPTHKDAASAVRAEEKTYTTNNLYADGKVS